MKLYLFQNLSLRFILTIFLKFHKFRPRYSYKICPYITEGFRLQLAVCMKYINGKLILTATNS